MHFSFLHPFKLDLHSRETPPAVVTYAMEHNTSEGGEFLNDALRMEDIVLTPTSPEDALEDLKNRGYSPDLDTDSFCLYCSALDLRLEQDACPVEAPHPLLLDMHDKDPDRA